MSEVIKINTVDHISYGSKTSIQEYQLLDLVSENDPILKELMPEFDFKNPPIDPVRLASDLVENCKGRSGFGLAANQMGFKYRVFVMGTDDEYVAFFNPKILSYSTESQIILEGCLTFPNLGIRVERAKSIEVEYQDFKGEVKTKTFTGLTAQCFQHELDHLNGICYTVRAKPLALKSGLKKREKLNKMIKRYVTTKKKVDNELITISK